MSDSLKEKNLLPKAFEKLIDEQNRISEQLNPLKNTIALIQSPAVLAMTKTIRDMCNNNAFNNVTNSFADTGLIGSMNSVNDIIQSNLDTLGIAMNAAQTAMSYKLAGMGINQGLNKVANDFKMKGFGNVTNDFAVKGLANSVNGVMQYNLDVWGKVMKVNQPLISAYNNGILRVVKDYNNSFLGFQQVNNIFNNIFTPILSNYLEIINERLQQSKIENEIINKYIEICSQVLFNAKWCAFVLMNDDLKMLVNINEIIETSKNLKSKNCIKRIDKCILDYYSDNKIEKMKRNWGKINKDKVVTKIMYDAIKAFHRKEYGITSIVLSSTWEGLIREKTGKTNGKNQDNIKDLFKHLVLENDSSNLFNEYFVKYIMYPCYSKEQIEEDVPGRNSNAHAWFNKYPSRKAALNAILFTDFVLKLDYTNSIEGEKSKEAV